MELVNATRLQAGFNLGIEPSGRELLVVVIKGTFTLPRPGERVDLYPEQLPLVLADTFTGEPGVSAPVREVDFAPGKRFCDVLLLGSAHAPHARPSSRVPVGLRVGSWQKTFAVVGDRVWIAGLSGIAASDPVPFVTKRISYDVAFGGNDTRHPDPAMHASYAPNPVGLGYHRHLRNEWVDGAPMPNTEEIDRPIVRPDGAYVPMSFGPIARSWPDRLRYAGTYDQAWLDEHFPFLPPDFDDRYYQAAPPDQQLPLPVGGEQVVLANLTPDGNRVFELPGFDAPVTVVPRAGGQEEHLATLDTIVFEPDLDRFSLTWRLARPLRRNLFEIAQVIVGRRGPGWWQKRAQVPFPIPVRGESATLGAPVHGQEAERAGES